MYPLIFRFLKFAIFSPNFLACLAAFLRSEHHWIPQQDPIHTKTPKTSNRHQKHRKHQVNTKTTPRTLPSHTAKFTITQNQYNHIVYIKTDYFAIKTDYFSAISAQKPVLQVEIPAFHVEIPPKFHQIAQFQQLHAISTKLAAK